MKLVKFSALCYTRMRALNWSQDLDSNLIVVFNIALSVLDQIVVLFL